MSESLLPRRQAEEFRARSRGGVPAEILAEAAVIVERVRSGGEESLREYTTRFGDCAPGEPPLRDGGDPQESSGRAPRGGAGTVSSGLLIGSEGSPSCNAPHSPRWTPPWPLGEPAIVSIRSTAQGATHPAAAIPCPPSVLMTRSPHVWRVSVRVGREAQPAPITLAAAAVAGADGVLAPAGPMRSRPWPSESDPSPRVMSSWAPGICT